MSSPARSPQFASWLRRSAAVLAGLCLGGLAQAAAPGCGVDPFAAPLPPGDREAAMKRPCGGEHLDWLVEPSDPGAPRSGVLRAQLDSVASQPLPACCASVRNSRCR